MKRAIAIAVLIAAGWAVAGLAAAPVQYRFSFPEPQHHWMQVEAVFADVPPGPIEVRISRSSPGRYSSHDFAKNVYDLHGFGADGRELPATRPDPSGWSFSGHGGGLAVKYKVYGDRVDGTYLAIDPTHAHINMPAAILWARGFDDRPSALTFDPPSGSRWTAATQLMPGARAFEFTAPNLQYLMDSPVELGPVTLRPFILGGRTFRFAIHHTGTDAEADALVRDAQKLVKVEGDLFGEYPEYEPGAYTFLADYLPWAAGDGMEHRNSTVMTSRSSIRSNRDDLLDTVAHEFFHGWNVERIRPRTLEPFDFDRPNISGELWLGEGFTQYYGDVAMARAGLADLASTARTLGYYLDAELTASGRRVRSLVEMSEMAPFTDAGHPADRTNWSSTYISYYTGGAATALALDLMLRERSTGRVSLDDFMRALWRGFGKPGGARPGLVDRPYTRGDLESTLADVAGDRAFAREFFERYVDGHDVPDLAPMLARAGLVLRKRARGHAWWGDLQLENVANGVRVGSLAAPGWPAYLAGLDQDAVVQQVDGVRVGSADEVTAAIARHKPGDRLPVVFAERGGASRSVVVTLAEDPHVELVPVEATGALPTAPQRALRERWLSPRP